MGIFNRNKKVLSIDFGASQVKLVEGRYSKKDIHITKALAIDLDKGLYENGQVEDMDKMILSLRDRIGKEKFSSDTVHGVINSTSIITRDITIPKVADDQIGAILTYQLGEFLPVNPEDYIIQYIVQDTIYEDDIEKLNVLIIGVPKTIVESHLNLIKNLGLKPEILDFQGNAMGKLLGYSPNINEEYTTKDMTIASIDMGYDSTNLTITENGKMKVNRVIDIGAKTLYNRLESLDLSKKEIEDFLDSIDDISMDIESMENQILRTTRMTFENILERIEMIFRYYRTRELGNEIHLGVLQGGLANIAGLEKLCFDYLGITVIRLDLLEKVKFQGDISKFGNAIGGLIRVGGV